MSALSLAGAAIALGSITVAALVADYLKIPTFKAIGLHRLWRLQSPQ
jgi:hypothetical protein